MLEIALNLDFVLAGERAHLQGLLHTHTREDAPSLRRLAHAHLHDAVRWYTIDPLSVEQHLADARRVDARNRAQRRRLARAIGANQRDDLAGLDAKRNALDGVDVAIKSVNVAQLEGGNAVAHAGLDSWGCSAVASVVAARPR